MSATSIPISVLNLFEREFRSFLWGHDLHQCRIHLISWEIICTPKASGGLGLQSIHQRQTALLGKLAANLVIHHNSLWTQLVSAKY